MNLPKDFLVKMKELLKEEYDEFIKSYDEEKSQGLRINTLKVSIDEFLKICPFNLKKIPWVKEGYYFSSDDRPGKHPYHDAGLYYIQEPSAMAVGEIMDSKPFERVLDLCAAPGGKSTHLASRMNQEGILVSNEIHPARAKILSQNIERLGIKNAVVTNETPENLAKKFKGYFDRILVDAPCSGEGMFRKDLGARDEWSLSNVYHCLKRQLDILENAATMLRVGGRLVYSTCTFSPEENEGVISNFIKLNSNFEIEDVKVYDGFDRGRSQWVEDAVDNIDRTIRIWPHKTQGEGHYIAVLRKTDGEDISKFNFINGVTNKKSIKEYFDFAEENLLENLQGQFVLFGEQLYVVPKEMLSLENMKVLRPGLHLGSIKKNRFEPSHALALYLNGDKVKNKLSFDKDSKEILYYLKGESIGVESGKGWYLVQVDGFSIGWGKLSGNILKNHYPKGLRWL
ncbi:SAM-dependent methyltransferase [Fervidicella metallireducens AeB]|uniref:SAM-dependent methyltransferase n=1 Tax=Fervidicella metallireducens AeB TaxID=1403537 RepID=A0A017RX53_9CLOT|nr:SAM-dependent methyltransferase [Fervidicella metallireducens AeB]